MKPVTKQKNRIIIFIGGTSRSGSTLLDLILGNNKQAVSLGEISSIIHPTKEKHFISRSKLLSDKIWGDIFRDKKSKLYDNIINAFPNKEIFIDSSKDPLWIDYHNRKMNNKCIVKNVLIYKKPSELANSFAKRGHNDKWLRACKHYHKKYNTLINDYFTIYLGDLLRDDKVLEQACKRLGVPYHENMKNYVGNNRALFFGSETPNKKRGVDNSKTDISDLHIPINGISSLEDIINLLESKNISKAGYVSNNQCIRYSIFYMAALRLKTIVAHAYIRSKHLTFMI